MKTKIVSELWIYPIKSLGGIRLPSSRIMSKGLEFDRRWMLIDTKNQFMTQRNLPQLCLFKLSQDPGKFIISYAGQTLELPFFSENESLSAVIWDDTVEVHEVSKLHSEWFSDILKMDCRLVNFPEINPRPVEPLFAIDGDQVSLADSFPLLIIGQSSLDDLNARLKETITINRFRPNIVYTGGQPYEEDNWKNVTIGTNQFVAVKRCSRCVVTTINPETGEKGKEPLATLSTYRNEHGNVNFGQNLIPLDCKSVKVGDEIV